MKNVRNFQESPKISLPVSENCHVESLEKLGYQRLNACLVDILLALVHHEDVVEGKEIVWLGERAAFDQKLRISDRFLDYLTAASFKFQRNERANANCNFHVVKRS
jgi:hypothetical protein